MHHFVSFHDFGRLFDADGDKSISAAEVWYHGQRNTLKSFTICLSLFFTLVTFHT